MLIVFFAPQHACVSCDMVKSLDRRQSPEGAHAFPPVSISMEMEDAERHARSLLTASTPASARPSEVIDPCLRSLVPLRRQLSCTCSAARTSKSFRRLASHYQSMTSASPPSSASGGQIPTKPWVSHPGRLLEGVIVVQESEDGKLSSELCWPAEVAGTQLQSFLCQGGFCPSAKTFRDPYPSGFDGQPAVLVLLETAINAQADPGNELYACICRGSCDSNLYCLITRVPLFTFHFKMLSVILDKSIDRAALVSELLSRTVDAQLLENGLQLHAGGEEARAPIAPFVPRLPVPQPVSRQKDWEHEYASWQAVWGLERLLEVSPTFVGEPLLQLLTHAMMEERILLLGQVQRISAVALAIRGLLWPFKWLHLCLSAPLQGRAADAIPLEDAPFPMISALPVLPARFPLVKDLPQGVVAVQLGAPPHDMLGPTETHYAPVKPGQLPKPHKDGNRSLEKDAPHVACLKKVAGVKKNMQKGSTTVPEAAREIQEAFASQVSALAHTISRYVQCTLNRLDAVTIELIFRQLSEVDRFMKWLQAPRCDRAFWEMFFSSQMCLELLDQEMTSQLESPREQGGQIAVEGESQSSSWAGRGENCFAHFKLCIPSRGR